MPRPPGTIMSLNPLSRRKREQNSGLRNVGAATSERESATDGRAIESAIPEDGAQHESKARYLKPPVVAA